MAYIKLGEKGFSLIPEGRQVIKVTKVEYDPAFGKMVINVVDCNGNSGRQQFNLIDKKGEVAEKTLKRYSWWVRTCMQDDNLEGIDSDDIVGKYISVKVSHESYEKDGKTRKAARFDEYETADGFPNAPAAPVAIDF